MAKKFKEFYAKGVTIGPAWVAMHADKGQMDFDVKGAAAVKQFRLAMKAHGYVEELVGENGDGLIYEFSKHGRPTVELAVDTTYKPIAAMWQVLNDE